MVIEDEFDAEFLREDPEGDRADESSASERSMKQIQEMQQKMAQAQAELATETVEASAGGGMVTVVVGGDLEVHEVRINPEAVDPDDVEMLQDLVAAATNEAPRRPGTRPEEARLASQAAST